MTEPRNMTLSEYKTEAKDCDIGLWRPRSWWGRIIAEATDGPYSHACGILWWGDALWQVAYDEKHGGYGAPLEASVFQHPGVIDIWRVKVDYDSAAVKKYMKGRLGYDYNWSYIRTIALLNAPFVRWFRVELAKRIVQKAERGTAGGICSSHIAYSFAEDSVFFLRKELSLVNPNDFYRSMITKYVGTLVGCESMVV